MAVPSFDDQEVLREWRESTLFRRMLRTSRAQATATLKHVHAHGFEDITMADTSLLAFLDTEGSTITTLAGRAGVTRQAASQHIAALERSGYVSRAPSDTDARAVIVRPSERGLAALHAAMTAVDELETGYRAVLGEQRYRDLLSALAILVDHVDPGGGLAKG